MVDHKFNPDYLRPAEFICEPDPRSSAFARIDFKSGTSRSLTPEDYHEAVSQYKLHENVPDKVVVQFETAKNLYLYAWFVYRFYPVVYMQVFACLELALRMAYEEEIPQEEYYPRQKKPALRALLRYAIDKGDVRNDGFHVWFRRAEMSARQNYERALLEEMNEKGLSSIDMDDNDIKVEDHDLKYDYVEQLLDIVPDIRNHYAHGSTTLHNQSLESIHVVSEIINQIF